MAAKTTTEIERVRYWQGQLLALEDLQTQLLVDEELRRLHNCAAHQAYGIAIGLGAALESGAINLPCGMAYDCAGRALIVEEDRTIPLPTPVIDPKVHDPIPMTLVLFYDPTSVHGIALTWKPARDVNAKTGVAITRLIYTKSTTNTITTNIDPDFRPVIARPFARPRLATGMTIPGGTAWKPWKIGIEDIGVQVVVDTSTEGFTQTPHYFAEAIAGSPTPDFVPAWFASISDPSTGGFTLQLLLRRITRESFDIVDPKVQVLDLPTQDKLAVNPLEAGKLLAKGDIVARVLPIAEQASLIQGISAEVATLDFALQGLTTPKQVAFGNPPRLAQVKTPPDPDLIFFEVTIRPSDTFNEQDVVLKLDAAMMTTSAARVLSIDEADGKVTMELSPPPIRGLTQNEKLGKLKQGLSVIHVDATDRKNMTVTSLDALGIGVVVVLLNGTAVENSVWTTIASMETDPTTGTKKIVLSEELQGLVDNSILQVATLGGIVDSATKLPDATKVELVDDADHSRVRQFRRGDVVAKKSEDGSFAQPVQVKSVRINSSTITLSGLISGLKQGDTMAAANFRVRATVLEPPIVTSTPAVTTVKVADSTVFSLPAAYVARVDDNGSLEASVPIPVTALPSAQTLQLGGTIENLKAGDVIGLCSFPATVKVEAIQSDGSILVSNGSSLEKADVVMAQHDPSSPTRFAIIAEKIAVNVIRLAEKIPGLTVNDDLSVANIRGVVNAELNDSNNPLKVKIQAPPVRVGDFLADITGWLQPRSGNSTTASIKAIIGNVITLSAPIDGILENDLIGMSSLTLPQFQIRLNTMPNLMIDDEVLLVGTDRLQGNTRSMYAKVSNFDTNLKLVELEPKDSPSPFTFRPEDISASVLFVRGSVLDLIKKQDLYVSWLACGEPDPMPRPCSGAVVSDCPCSQAKE